MNQKLFGLTAARLARKLCAPAVFLLVNSRPGGFLMVGTRQEDQGTRGPAAATNTRSLLEFPGPGLALDALKLNTFNWALISSQVSSMIIVQVWKLQRQLFTEPLNSFNNWCKEERKASHFHSRSSKFFGETATEKILSTFSFKTGAFGLPCFKNEPLIEYFSCGRHFISGRVLIYASESQNDTGSLKK